MEVSDDEEAEDSSDFDIPEGEMSNLGFGEGKDTSLQTPATKQALTPGTQLETPNLPSPKQVTAKEIVKQPSKQFEAAIKKVEVPLQLPIIKAI